MKEIVSMEEIVSPLVEESNINYESTFSETDEFPEDEHPQPIEEVGEGEQKFMLEIFPPCACDKKERRIPYYTSPREWLESTLSSDWQWHTYGEDITPFDHIPEYYHSRRYVPKFFSDGSKTTYSQGGGMKYVPVTSLTEENCRYIKTTVFDTIVARTSEDGTEVPTLSTISKWNNLYLIDYDGEWKGNLSDLNECLMKLYDILPNACLIKPSMSVGIHIVILSSSETFDLEEYITYAFMGYNVIKDFFKFNKEELVEQVCDTHFIVNPIQLLVLNTVFYLKGNRLCVRDYGYARDYPKPMSKTEWQARRSELDPTLYQDVLDQLKSKKEDATLYDPHPTRICVRNKSSKIIIGEDHRYTINKDFTIAGVPYHGNDLRWRIVKAIYELLPEETRDKDIVGILQKHFTNHEEMLRSLNTIISYIYPSNRLISIWVLQNILNKSVSYTHQIELNDSEYLSDFSAQIVSALDEGPVYVASSPGTGKTEFAKKLLEELNRVIVVVHQNSIKDSKFADSPYAYDPTSVKNLIREDRDTPPSKMVLVWDQFVKVYQRFSREGYCDWSEYTFIFDESHNLVTQLGFRGIVSKLARIIPTLSRVVLMTGTPAGEDCILPQKQLTSYKVSKKQKTIYNFHPIRLICGNDNVGRRERGYIIDYINKGNYDLTIIYDNYEHKKWADDLPHFVHYTKAENGSLDVSEVNKLKGTKKNGIICTCYMGEGVDITSNLRSINKALVVVNVDRFMNPHELEQIVHRLRDANVVDVLVCSHSEKVANSQFYKANKEEQSVLQGYLYDCSFKTSQRSDLYDEMIGIPSEELSREDYEQLSENNSPISRLLTINRKMAQTPLSIYTLSSMKAYSDQYIIKDIEDVDVSDEKIEKGKNSHDKQFDQWVGDNIANLEGKLRKDEDVTLFVDELDGKYSVSRVQLRNVFELMLTLNDWNILRDCISFFKNKDGKTIGWRAISSFIQSVQLRDKREVNFYSRGLDATQHLKKLVSSNDLVISNLKDMLNFSLTPDVPFKELVCEYKFGEGPTVIQLGGREPQRRECETKSIFKSNRRTKVASHTKSLTIRNIHTREEYSFESKLKCQEQMKWGRVQLSNLFRGVGLLTKDWEIVV